MRELSKKIIAEDILGRDLKTGSLLPPSRALAEKHRTSFVTMIKALQELQAAGILKKKGRRLAVGSLHRLRRHLQARHSILWLLMHPSEYYQEFLDGIRSEMRKVFPESSLVILPYQDDSESVLESLRLVQRHPDTLGFIFRAHQIRDAADISQVISQTSVPAVTLGIPGAGLNRILIDHKGLAVKMVEGLQKKGYTDFLWAMRPGRLDAGRMERRDMWLEALLSLGLSGAWQDLNVETKALARWYTVVKGLLQKKRKPLILAYNDREALELVPVWDLEKWQGKVGLVGFDHLSLGAQKELLRGGTLTTVDGRHAEAGVEAVRLIHLRSKNPRLPPGSVSIKARIWTGDTAA